MALNARINSDLAIASCLAFMRAGEQSAAPAFAQIVTRLSLGEYAYAAGSIAALIEDEKRHDIQLAAATVGLPFVSTGVDSGSFQEITRTVRHSSAGVLETRAAHFEALGIDSSLWIRSIDRERSPD